MTSNLCFTQFLLYVLKVHSSIFMCVHFHVLQFSIFDFKLRLYHFRLLYLCLLTSFINLSDTIIFHTWHCCPLLFTLNKICSYNQFIRIHYRVMFLFSSLFYQFHFKTISIFYQWWKWDCWFGLSYHFIQVYLLLTRQCHQTEWS